MGYDATNTFRKETRKEEVSEFLTILGYVKYSGTEFRFYKDEDYKYHEGVSAYLRVNKKIVEVDTHTSVWRSKADSGFHNFTIRQLHKRFGGHFQSDFGKGRYLRFNNVEREKAEAGCYEAHSRFRSNMVKVSVYLTQRATTNPAPDIKPAIIRKYPFIAATNWFIISNNLVLPYIVSCIEDYFKYTYIALLRYSPRKLSILKGGRILPDDLLRITEGEMKVEDAIAKTMSFQNIAKVCEHFKDVDNSLDIYGLLKKPYKRRKESLYDTLDRVLNQRHALIHQNVLTGDYTNERVGRDFRTLEAAVTRVYEKLIQHYNWQPGFPY